MSIDFLHIVGFLITLILIIGVGFYSGTKIKKSDDFAVGGKKAGPWIVCGTIMGALVGGQATIGTAQLAYMYGMSAWWFTLGSGLGCLVMAWGYVKPMRHSGCSTLMEVINQEYGQKAEFVGSILSTIGIFISIVSQVVSACALITAIFDINQWIAIGIAVGLMIIYVIFGGVWGAGMGGILKLFLLYGLSILGLLVVLITTKGVSGLTNLVNDVMINTGIGEISGITDESAVSDQFFNLTARGISKDIGSGLSLILGVLSTQTYAQAIWAAKTDSKARKGALLSTFLIPPIGIACIAIGLFMRGHAITMDEINQLLDLGKTVPKGLIVLESSAQVFPEFIINYLPKVIGGMALGTLLITIVGGGAGLSLGASVIIVEDVFARFWTRISEDRINLIVTRATIITILFIAAIVGGISSDAIINDMGFLSMGLRGAVVCVPFTCALFFKDKISRLSVMESIILGPLAVIVGNLAGLPFDPLFLGILINIACVTTGYISKSKFNSIN